MFDVAVLGGGPAGWAVARACARAGLLTALVDQDPHRSWPATYGAWHDELPTWALPAVAVAPARTRVRTPGSRYLPRRYTVLDNTRLGDLLRDSDVRTVAGYARALRPLRHGTVIDLTGGGTLRARVVVEATGAAHGLPRRWPRRAPHAEQTATGVVVTTEEAGAVVGDAASTALFMDWSHAPLAGEPASFLYALPLPGNRVLLEETCLAHRPGLSHPLLERRLRTRLAAAGLNPAARATEFVRIPLDLGTGRAGPAARARPVVPFGVAAGLVHPATGYHLATALELAPRVAASLADGLRRGHRPAARVARNEVWSPAAVTVHALRRKGMRALLAMPADALPEFFELFFDLPAQHQRAFLSGREDVLGTVAAMRAVFAAAPRRLRRHLL
ncbi:lycopene cyclase family protein [Haloechinothrix sp. YIM 98757]|uniref:Lycopene cyclase family protein n=1 Tax=Haloechinothrix aidingensis TaxID=2752311 RepID=A0A838A068_9PSEU|nr:lycopene cyclase family protein [Haloechinothrix aidingensis]